MGIDLMNFLGREWAAVATRINEVILNPSAVVDIPDDPRTFWVRKEDRLDATTKRHYNHVTIYEWDEQERRAYNAALKNR